MRYIWLVGLREFLENARTKGFWIGIFLFPVIILVSGALPILLAKKGISTRHYVVIDQTGEFAPKVRTELGRQRTTEVEDALHDFARRDPAPRELARFIRASGSNQPLSRLDLDGWKRHAGSNYLTVSGFNPPRAAWLEVPVPKGINPSNDVPSIEAQLRPWLRGEFTLPPSEANPSPKLFAAVIIPRGYGVGTNESASLRYWAENTADTSLRDSIQRQLSDELRRREYRSLGVDPAIIARVEARRAPITDLNPRKAEGEEKVGMADRLRQWAPSFFVYLLWVSIFAVSQMLLNSVIEEKSNRIIEVLLSSVTPGELMLGKLLGVAMTGGIMMTAWFGSIIGMASVQARIFSSAAAAGAVNPAASLPTDVLSLFQSTWLLPGFAAYFILGYIAYATIFLTIGSLCNTLKDAQNFMGPVMLVLMVPLFLMPFIPRDPNGPIATIFSWIPLYTPFVMMNRITGSPPLFDVIGTGIVLVGFDILILWGCGRIFRLAILRTGQPPRIIELFRWLRNR
jgi:ABC-2 type transport system permease protein